LPSACRATLTEKRDFIVGITVRVTTLVPIASPSPARYSRCTRSSRKRDQVAQHLVAPPAQRKADLSSPRHAYQLSMASLSIETLKIHADVRTKQRPCETDASPASPSHGGGPKPAYHGVNVNITSAV
jgi:hypothetical protein